MLTTVNAMAVAVGASAKRKATDPELRVLDDDEDPGLEFRREPSYHVEHARSHGCRALVLRADEEEAR